MSASVNRHGVSIKHNETVESVWVCTRCAALIRKVGQVRDVLCRSWRSKARPEVCTVRQVVCDAWQIRQVGWHIYLRHLSQVWHIEIRLCCLWEKKNHQEYSWNVTFQILHTKEIKLRIGFGWKRVSEVPVSLVVLSWWWTTVHQTASLLFLSLVLCVFLSPLPPEDQGTHTSYIFKNPQSERHEEHISM